MIARGAKSGPKPGDTFYCVCRHCGGRRTISTGYRVRYPDGVKDLFAENDCDCPKPPSALVPVACDLCGETGKHWLGCEYIGQPESPKDGAPHA